MDLHASSHPNHAHQLGVVEQYLYLKYFYTFYTNRLFWQRLASLIPYHTIEGLCNKPVPLRHNIASLIVHSPLNAHLMVLKSHHHYRLDTWSMVQNPKPWMVFFLKCRHEYFVDLIVFVVLVIKKNLPLYNLKQFYVCHLKNTNQVH